MAIATSTLIIIAAATAVASAGISAYSAYEQGRSQAKMAEYNALIARQNAKLAGEQIGIVTKEKAIEAARLRRNTEDILASQRASFGKAGVEMAGTPLMVAAETMTELELDALAIRYAGTIEQSRILAQQAGLRQEAQLQGMVGRQATLAGNLGAASSLLTGVSSAASQGAFIYSLKKRQEV